MVEICAEIHRTLKPSGTFWLNVGDSYAGYHGNKNAEIPTSALNGWTNGTNENKRTSAIEAGFKAKDLCMVPNRLAIALQRPTLKCRGCGAEAHQSKWGRWPNGGLICPGCEKSKGHDIARPGWWVRSEIIWAKPNPMPESVTDRPTTAHEKVWMLTKAARYNYDGDAVRVDFADKRMGNPGGGGHYARQAYQGIAGPDEQSGLQKGEWLKGEEYGGRNLRNYEPAPVQVWPIATRPFLGAHFATFPAELVERCLLAGCPKDGHVLDPFAGAGTVGLVADAMNLDWTLIELNPEYAAMAEARIKARIAKAKGPRAELCSETPSLFE